MELPFSFGRRDECCMEQLGRLLSPEEVAERLTVTPRTVRDWLRAGKLRGTKAGRLWRVSEEAVCEFLEAGEARAVKGQVPLATSPQVD